MAAPVPAGSRRYGPNLDSYRLWNRDEIEISYAPTRNVYENKGCSKEQPRMSLKTKEISTKAEMLLKTERLRQLRGGSNFHEIVFLGGS